MILEKHLKKLTHFGMRKIFEMFPTQNTLRCLPQFDATKNTQWNIGLWEPKSLSITKKPLSDHFPCLYHVTQSSNYKGTQIFLVTIYLADNLDETYWATCVKDDAPKFGRRKCYPVDAELNASKRAF